MKNLEISCLCIEILHYVQDDIVFCMPFYFETVYSSSICQLSFALNASAYMRICFTMASRPLLRVGERCSCRPMRGMK